MGNSNIAEPTGDVVAQVSNTAEEFLYFHLRDKDHEFMMGLGDILECVKFAEEEGCVPKLPLDWWCKMASRYPGLMVLDDAPEKENEGV